MNRIIRKFNKKNKWHWVLAVLFAGGLLMAMPAAFVFLHGFHVKTLPYVVTPLVPFLIARTAFRNLGGYDDLTVNEMAIQCKRYFWRAGWAVSLLYFFGCLFQGPAKWIATEQLVTTLVYGWFICFVLGLFTKASGKRRTRVNAVPKVNLYPGTRPRQYPDDMRITPRV